MSSTFLTFSPISSDLIVKKSKEIVQCICNCTAGMYGQLNIYVRDESTMCLGHIISLSLLASHSVSPNCEYSMIALNIKINVKYCFILLKLVSKMVLKNFQNIVVQAQNCYKWLKSFKNHLSFWVIISLNFAEIFIWFVYKSDLGQQKNCKSLNNS